MTIVKVHVSNPSGLVAYLLRLSLQDPNGKLIDDVHFSDNYVTIEPHGQRTITCKLQGNRKFKVRLTGN